MPDTAKAEITKHSMIFNQPPPSNAISAWNQGALNSGSYLDISYSPTITWQDTTSAATYASVADVLPAQDYYNILSS